ncbi:GNAT family acetyltransferase [Microvirga alba]|uniref:GNAT family acetyltransferase n=1 Tax=Microvirga alba TaxID=2791025 RepID=A0A931FQN7_9HYPH|nr:GNAT family acetyltransferase [Microvirga alba]MBF9233678.1 GNAT family acetyltransferase [Microvirga alba]
MMIEIGVLEPHETNTAVALWRKVNLTRPWNDPYADIELALKTPLSTVLVGRLNGGVVATAMIGSDGHRAWVYYLGIDPSIQGQGLGRKMMEACEAWASERDVRKIQLMVRNDNLSVREFYKSLGYDLSEVVVLSRWLDDNSKELERRALADRR